jgi:glycosyltransferase involved in cell wall biosynthesis
MKGLDEIFPSEAFMRAAFEKLTPAERSATSGRVRYIGGLQSSIRMADIYRAADIYVSPYRAEGFNLPVLEAAACGKPVVVTAGGASEDFVTDAFALKVSGTPRTTEMMGATGHFIEPDVGHLVSQLERAITDTDWRTTAGAAATAHAAKNFTWDQAAAGIVAAAFPGDGAA